ncbi:hypothetical protein D8674_027391 [Pyrus ussuriensis x Pyrus communis]|uniref:Uncharacterized protein n=1 Tax=Pyrus ussuriensis x Pyrus communis TaxID=2448454 RepID=A0A5N5IC45_9ROSA|nr:hypothetical protein D8674_027391 [Pyrus ussuriensis x Pyrus communis]
MGGEEEGRGEQGNEEENTGEKRAKSKKWKNQNKAKIESKSSSWYLEGDGGVALRVTERNEKEEEEEVQRREGREV